VLPRLTKLRELCDLIMAEPRFSAFPVIDGPRAEPSTFPRPSADRSGPWRCDLSPFATKRTFSPGTLACGVEDVLGARRISDLTWRSLFGTSMTQGSCALLEEDSSGER